MKRIALGLALMMVSAVCGAAEHPALPPGSLMTMRIDGELTIDTAGKVAAYDIATPLEPAVKQAVDRAVATWRFSPVIADDRPAQARAGMRITLAARPVEAGYAISVDNVTFRDPAGTPEKMLAKREKNASISSASMTPPSYPVGIYRSGITGQVLLYIRVSPEGKAEDVVAFQSTLFNSSGTEKSLALARKQLEEASVRAARNWRFKVHSEVPANDLTPRDLTVTVPIQYRFDPDPDAPGEWRIEARGARAIVPWLVGEAGVRYAGVSDLDANNVQPLSDGFKFVEDPVGKAL
jgi:outer membrane biosynthesis protein TonB